MDKKIITIIILAILLLGAIGYFGYGKYNIYKQNKELDLMQSGYNLAITQIMQKAEACEEISITIDDKIIKLRNIDCKNGE